MNFDFFNFYYKYIWTETDFENLQALLKSLNTENNIGAFGAAVLKGLDYASASTWTVNINSGIAVDPNGDILSSLGGSIVASGPSGGLGRKSLVVARLLQTDINYINDPNNPTNTVPLNTRNSTQLVVIDGTPGASPSYPSKLSGDVILFGLVIGGADTQITSASIDYSVSESVGKNSELLNYGKVYDAIIYNGKYSTHRTIQDYVSASGSSANKKILVKDDQTLTAELTISGNNTTIEFAPGVTVQSSAAASGLILTGTGIKIKDGRFKDFTNAIIFRGEYGQIIGTRFKTCTNEIVDETTNGFPAIALQTEA